VSGAPAPQPEPAVEGAAFTPLVKGTATVVVAGMALYGLRSVEAHGASPGNGSVWLFLGLLSLMVLYGFWWMLISRTRVTSTHLHQTWWSDKRVAIADITQTKLILVPGLTWLISPRLVVRTHRGGSTVFHAAEPAVIAAFARLSLGMPALGEDTDGR
jgi:hypothetical protein